MTYYAVIDTNILVSALLSSHENAATVQVVSRLFSNDGILAEYNEVLRRKKFHFAYFISMQIKSDILIDFNFLSWCIRISSSI